MTLSCSLRARYRSIPDRQRGVTLVVVLLILLVVTVLGIGGAQMALLSEKSTRYDRDYLIASQAAEVALMDAELEINGPNAFVNRRAEPWLFPATGCGTTGGMRGLCATLSGPAKPAWQTVDFLETDATARAVAEVGEFTGRVFDAGLAGMRPELKPRYVIELIPDNTPGAALDAPKLYRITAMGFGPRKEVQVVLHSVFRRSS